MLHFWLFIDGACECKPLKEGEAALVTSVGAILVSADGRGLRCLDYAK